MSKKNKGPFLSENGEEIEDWDKQFDSLVEENVEAAASSRSHARKSTAPPPMPLDVLVAESEELEEVRNLKTGEFEIVPTTGPPPLKKNSERIVVDESLISSVEEVDHALEAMDEAEAIEVLEAQTMDAPLDVEDASDLVVSETPHEEPGSDVFEGGEETPVTEEKRIPEVACAARDSLGAEIEEIEFWQREFEASRDPNAGLRAVEVAIGANQVSRSAELLERVDGAGSEWAPKTAPLWEQHESVDKAQVFSRQLKTIASSDESSLPAMAKVEDEGLGARELLRSLSDSRLEVRAERLSAWEQRDTKAIRQSYEESGLLACLADGELPEDNAAVPGEIAAALSWRSGIKKKDVVGALMQSLELAPSEPVWSFLLGTMAKDPEIQANALDGWNAFGDAEKRFSRMKEWETKHGTAALKDGFSSQFQSKEKDPENNEAQCAGDADLSGLSLDWERRGHFAAQDWVDGLLANEEVEILPMGEAQNRVAAVMSLDFGAATDWDKAAEIRLDNMSSNHAETVLTSHFCFQANEIDEGRRLLDQVEEQDVGFPKSKWFVDWNKPKNEELSTSRELREAEAFELDSDWENALSSYNKLLEQEPAAVVGLLRAAERSGDASAVALALEVALNSSASMREFWACELADHLMDLPGVTSPKVQECLAEMSSSLPLARRRELIGKRGGNVAEVAAVAEAIGSLVEDEVDRAQALLESGCIHRVLGNTESAHECFRDVLQTHPGSRLALLGLSLGDVPAGRMQERAEVEKKIGLLFEEGSQSRSSLWCRAATTAASANQELASELSAEAWRQSKDYAPALWLWRRMSAKSENWGGLAESFLVEERISSGRDKRLAALSMLRQNDQEGAVEVLVRAAKDDPADEETFLLARDALRATEGGDSQLIQLLQNRIEHETTKDGQVETLSECLKLLEAGGETFHAKDVCSQLSALDPGNPVVLLAKGREAFEAKDWEEATRLLSARTRLQGDSKGTADACELLALVQHGQQNNTAGAFTLYKRSLMLGRFSTSTICGLLETAREIGEQESALNILRDVAGTETIDINSRLVVIKSLVHSGDGESAADWAFDLLETGDPSDLEGIFEELEDEEGTAAFCASLLSRYREAGRMEPGYLRRLSLLNEKWADAGARGARSAAAFSLQSAQMYEGADVASAPSPPSSFELFQGDFADRHVFSTLWMRDAASLFRRIKPGLSKHLAGDIKKYGVGRGDRVREESTLVRNVREITASMGVPEIDIYRSGNGRTFRVVAGATPSLIVGAELCESATPAEARFIAGWSGFLLSSGLAVTLDLGAQESNLLLNCLIGLIREGELSEAEYEFARGRKLKKLSGLDSLELMPFARSLNDVKDRSDLARLALVGANRVGLVACHDMLATMKVLSGNKRVDITDYVATNEAVDVMEYSSSESLVRLVGKLLG